MLPLSPSKLGRYEIVDEIGKGAMGVVYLARDPLIGRLVALKTFRIGYSIKDAELEQFRARFIREAQSAGILSHPNIVTIHDVVERGEQGIAFIAMEYVRGTNLKSVLQEPQRPTMTYISEILTQIADGLDYAHSCKVIHRDIKPANILITTDNRAKITDFGIARLDTSNLTQEGQLLGTPNYMSPEQILGRDVDHRADIFSLGVVLYEMVTRHKPFQGENLTVVSHRIVYEHFTPPREYADDLLPGTEQILAKALEKDPTRRYQRARDMADDLRRVLGSVGRSDLLNETQSLSATAVLPVNLVRGGSGVAAAGAAAAGAGAVGAAVPPSGTGAPAALAATAPIASVAQSEAPGTSALAGRGPVLVGKPGPVPPGGAIAGERSQAPPAGGLAVGVPAPAGTAATGPRTSLWQRLTGRSGVGSGAVVGGAPGGIAPAGAPGGWIPASGPPALTAPAPAPAVGVPAALPGPSLGLSPSGEVSTVDPAPGALPATAASTALAGTAALATVVLPHRLEAPAGAATSPAAPAPPGALGTQEPRPQIHPAAVPAAHPHSTHPLALPPAIPSAGADPLIHPPPTPAPPPPGSPAVPRPASVRGRFALPSPVRLAAAAAVGAVLGLLLAALPWLWMRSLRALPPTRTAARFDAEQPAREQLLALLRDGRRRLDAGDPDGAAAAFRAAEQLVPGRLGVRKLREEAERRQHDTRQRIDQEKALESKLEEGRLALAGRHYDEAEAAAQAVLALSPGNTVAEGILASVKEGRSRRRDRAASASAQAAAHAVEATSPALRPDAAVRGSQAPSPAPPDIKEATLELAFFSKQAEGSLLIYLNGRKVLQEPFRFYEKAGLFRSRPTTGWVRRSFHLPAGNAEIRLYVTPHGSAAVVRTLAGTFPGGAARRLDVQLDDGGQVTAQLN